MRKIKRFVLNDSFTVLSAEAQKRIKGGDYPFGSSNYYYGCSELTSSSSCNGACIITYVWDNGAAGGGGSETKDGTCEWNSASSSCFCNVN